jgi:hypothetical protein
MAWATRKGINLRNTAGYITDPTNTSYLVDGDAYPTTRSIGGENVTYGYTDSATRDSFDIDDTKGRLAGCCFSLDADLTIRVDLPEAGTYSFRLAMGSTNGGFGTLQSELYDNASLLDTFTGDTSGVAGSFIDANEVQRVDAATWESSNVAREYTFASTIAIVKLYFDGAPTTPIAHFSLEQLVAGTAAAVMQMAALTRRRRG